MHIFAAALHSALIARQWPVVTEYLAFQELGQVFAKIELDGKRLAQMGSPVPTRDELSQALADLLRERFLRPDADFVRASLDKPERAKPARVFRVSDIPDGSAEDICALVDPFCYISHLSAMQRYNLTDRYPQSLHLTSPTPTAWRKLRNERMQNTSLPGISLERIALPDYVRRRAIIQHSSTYQPNLIPIRDSFARIAEIGDVFVQMLDRPDLCGGMVYVIETWVRYAELHMDSIIDAVERHPQSIVKVRAGYLIDEILGLANEKVFSWAHYAQRGGSRKLDASKPYIAIFSEKWMISLNVESEFIPPPCRP